MNILNHFDLPYCENNLNVIGSPCNGGKSSALEILMLEYVQKGFNCLYIGEIHKNHFFKRINRKMKQYEHKTNKNNGNIFYLHRDNTTKLKDIIESNEIKSVFFDDYVQHKRVNNTKMLLTEKVIEKEENRYSMTRDIIRHNMNLINDIKNICNVSCYVSTNLNKRISSTIGFDASIDATVMMSDVYMTVNRSSKNINTRINVVKNRYGNESTKDLEIIL